MKARNGKDLQRVPHQKPQFVHVSLGIGELMLDLASEGDELIA